MPDDPFGMVAASFVASSSIVAPCLNCIVRQPEQAVLFLCRSPPSLSLCPLRGGGHGLSRIGGASSWPIASLTPDGILWMMM